MWSRTSVLAAGLFGLALALRCVGLNGGLWLDEIFSLLDSFRAPLATLLSRYPGDTQHQLYAIFGNLAHSALGEAPWVIRLPAALFGAATVPALYLLGREVVEAREALLAALLLAVSYHHVWFSQNARGYTLLALCVVLSTHCLVRALATGAARHWVGYGVAAGLGVYTHLTMVQVVAGQAIVVLLAIARPRWLRLERPRGARVLLGLGLAAGLPLVLYAPVLPQMVDFFLDGPSRLSGVSTPGWALREAFDVLRIGFGGLGVAVAVGVVLLGAGLASLARRHPVACGLFVAPAAVLLASPLARGTMYPRFFFSLIGLGVLIGVRGTFAAAGWAAARSGRPGAGRRGVAWGTAAMIVAIGLSAVSLGRNYRLPKQDFGGARNWVESARQPGDAIATAGIARVPFRRYLELDWTVVRTPPDLERLRAAHDRVWLVYVFPRYLERSAPELTEVIRSECPSPRAFRGTVGDGDVLVCAFAGRAPASAADGGGART